MVPTSRIWPRSSSRGRAPPEDLPDKLRGTPDRASRRLREPVNPVSSSLPGCALPFPSPLPTATIARKDRRSVGRPGQEKASGPWIRIVLHLDFRKQRRRPLNLVDDDFVIHALDERRWHSSAQPSAGQAYSCRSAGFRSIRSHGYQPALRQVLFLYFSYSWLDSIHLMANLHRFNHDAAAPRGSARARICRCRRGP